METLVIFFAEYFPYVVAALFVGFAFSRLSGRKTRLLLFGEGILAAFVSRGFVELFRFFIHRPRPFIADPSIIPLISEASYSFPSGHAAFFFALSTVVYIYDKRWGLWFFIASLIVGFARVMAGVHYLTDILGGAVLGIAVGYGMQWLLVRLRKGASAQDKVHMLSRSEMDRK